MSKIKRFEDIDCWKKARELTKSIYSILAWVLSSRKTRMLSGLIKYLRQSEMVGRKYT